MSKISVTYHAPKGDEKVVETHGLTFYHGQAVELDDKEHGAFLAKAKRNPHFLVGDQTADDAFGENGGDAGTQPKSIDEMNIDELRAEAEKRGIPHDGVSKPDLKKLLKQQ
jgi:hypothetical protein